MRAGLERPTTPKLSICITTLNRVGFIGRTLDSILSQATEECEIVVLDAASTDGTEAVLMRYAGLNKNLQYIRQGTNNGLDQDYDRSVELACGEYCWLMTDDDLLNPGSIECVLNVLRDKPSMVIANVESRDLSMSRSEGLQRPWLSFDADRVYPPGDMDRLFIEVGPVLRYIGCFIIRRSVWLERERGLAFGSLFNYLSVIFQRPLPNKAVVIARPLISYRWGNSHAWISGLFETIAVRFPALVWSLRISEEAKNKLCRREPWKSAHELLFFRGRGLYSISEYRSLVRPRLSSFKESLAPLFIACLPGVVVNAMFIVYYSRTNKLFEGVWEPQVVVQMMKRSPFYVRNWSVFRRALKADASVIP